MAAQGGTVKMKLRESYAIPDELIHLADFLLSTVLLTVS
jgi:hypothetical protein